MNSTLRFLTLCAHITPNINGIDLCGIGDECLNGFVENKTILNRTILNRAIAKAKNIKSYIDNKIVLADDNQRIETIGKKLCAVLNNGPEVHENLKETILKEWLFVLPRIMRRPTLLKLCANVVRKNAKYRVRIWVPLM